MEPDLESEMLKATKREIAEDSQQKPGAQLDSSCGLSSAVVLSGIRGTFDENLKSVSGWFQ